MVYLVLVLLTNARTTHNEHDFMTSHELLTIVSINVMC